MIITRKHLSRRTMLRGIGAGIALPLLDSMVPAFTAVAKTAARPTKRFCAIYVPNGMNLDRWTPTTEGAAYEMTPIMQPLAPYRRHVLPVSGASTMAVADPTPDENAGGNHTRAQAAFLTCARPKKTEGSELRAGVSVDQIVASEFGRFTQLSSLELSFESVDAVGSCDTGYACAYSSTVSWRTATTPLPMETNPRAVFERMFGVTSSTDPRARLARIREERSILDSVTEDVSRLQLDLGSTDRLKLTQYLEAVRDIERRVQKAEEQNGQQLMVVDRPGGVPAVFEDYAKVMFDLMGLAYQADLTRVVTLMYGREQSGRAYPEVGVSEAHHAVSHHQGRPETLDKLARISTYHASLFAYFLEKLRSTPDGDGSLLDHAIVLYGSGLGDPDSHQHRQLPIILAGGGGGALTGGRHVVLPKDTPLSNLHLTVLDKLGVNVERFGDSTGRIDTASL